MKSRVSLFLFSLLSVLLILSISCKKEIPKIAYLNPSDFQSEGFLDSETYQIIENGIFFNNKVIRPRYRYYIPCSIPSSFDTSKIEEFNQKTLWKRRDSADLCAVQQILDYNFPMFREDSGKDEKNLEKIFKSPQIKNILILKETLYERSCLAAKARALYKWFMKTKDVPLLNHYLDENGFHPDNNTKEVIDSDFVLLDGFESNFFPPSFWFSGNSEMQLKKLDERLKKRKIHWEVIEERKIFSPNIICRVVVHFRRESLANDYPFIHTR